MNDRQESIIIKTIKKKDSTHVLQRSTNKEADEKLRISRQTGNAMVT
jgi:hypothetical protein